MRDRPPGGWRGNSRRPRPHPASGPHPRRTGRGRLRPGVGPSELFVYGTLCFPEVARALLGRLPCSRPAAAAGWRAAALPGRAYPGPVP
ncbi:gamma-glutamylcyclotransferase, partial [Frankia sp. CiP1_Cm_nod2]|uniref:gamma-glutamylcyclotransferase n=1 Tax=Frankia sp. CiP1_Cm_nod2 TaxID=2897161 RepID=UPI004043DF2F